VVSKAVSTDSTYKKANGARCQWLTPVILVIWEAGIGRITGKAGLAKNEALSPK
jgi:hypothetical protein